MFAAAADAAKVTTELDIFPLLMGLFGGLAIFLYGMDKMADSLKAVAGQRMKDILSRLTTNRFTGAITGALVTAVIQSSSVTTVLVVGFITAGIMSLSQSVGIIMGANIGTTITAQIIAFKVTKYALLGIAIGFGVEFVGKTERARHYGAMLMGLGLVFFGMGVMGEAMHPLRSYQPFLDSMANMESPLVGIAVAAVFTALVQSSSATTGIVIVMASEGLISLTAGIALILGSNIGTCATALLATIGKPREALRASVVHVLFNVIGVVLCVPLIAPLATLVEGMSDDIPRQIANAHTVFNVAATTIFIWFAGPIARLAETLVKDRPIEEADEIRARYLDRELLVTPTLALDRARLEMLHMGERVTEMMKAALPAVTTGTNEDLSVVARMDDAVDVLHGKMISYMGDISRTNLTERHSDELLGLMESINDLENIGDIIETNLVSHGERRIATGLAISDETRQKIEEFHAQVARALDLSLQAIGQRNETAARHVVSMSRDISRLSSEASKHGAARLIADEPNRVEAYSVEMDIFADLKRIYYFAARLARMQLPEGDGARHPRLTMVG